MTDPIQIVPPEGTPSVPAQPPEEDAPGTPLERYVAGCIERDLVRRGVTGLRSPEAIKRALARSKAAMVAAGRGDVAERVSAALDAAAPLLRGAAQAAVETRSTAVSAARTFVGFVMEHEGIIDSPSALARLLSASRWTAIESHLHEVMLATSPKGAELGELLKLADRASTRAAYDLDRALALHREVIALRPKPAAFAWPAVPLVQPDPFPSRPRVPVDEAEDEQIDDEQVESDDEAEPNPVVREDEEPERKPAVMVVPEVWSSALPSGVAMGGRRGMAPAFAIVPIDPTTGRAQPTRPPGPTPEAKREMRSKGWEWSDGEQRWVSTKGANGDE